MNILQDETSVLIFQSSPEYPDQYITNAEEKENNEKNNRP